MGSFILEHRMLNLLVSWFISSLIHVLDNLLLSLEEFMLKIV